MTVIDDRIVEAGLVPARSTGDHQGRPYEPRTYSENPLDHEQISIPAGGSFPGSHKASPVEFELRLNQFASKLDLEREIPILHLESLDRYWFFPGDVGVLVRQHNPIGKDGLSEQTSLSQKDLDPRNRQKRLQFGGVLVGGVVPVSLGYIAHLPRTARSSSSRSVRGLFCCGSC